MSASRHIRRARGEHKRRVPPGSAALIFSRDGDELELRAMLPTGKASGPMPDHVQLAVACASYARELMDASEETGETTEEVSDGG